MSDISDDNLEALLSQATPRPTPGASAEAAVRAAVHEEWVGVTKRQSREQALWRYSMAAGLALIAIAVLIVNRPVTDVPIGVAQIQKSVGAVYILGPSSELTPIDDTRTLRTGQTIVTDSGSGIALNWLGGGSLRLDEKSEVKFVGAEEIALQRGQIYFDSRPSILSTAPITTDAAPLSIETSFGSVSHVGTQYMTAVSSDALAVTVREGEVTVRGRARDFDVESGKRGELTSSGTVTYLDVDPYGEAWSWAADISPEVSVDGRSIHDFLGWAARELGYEVNYIGAAEARAKEGDLKGMIDMPPDAALRFWMPATGIDWHVDGGVLYVGQNE